MGHKNKKEKSESCKANYRSQRFAEKHTPKTMKDQNEDKNSNKENDVLQQFKERKKEQKKTSKKSDISKLEISEKVYEIEINEDMPIRNERIRADHTPTANPSNSSVNDEVQIEKVDSNIPKPPSLGGLSTWLNNKIQKDIPITNKTDQQKSILLPEDLDKDIKEKFKELQALSSGDFFESGKLIRDLRQFCACSVENNASLKKELQASYDEYLNEKYETKKLKLIETITSDQIKLVQSQEESVSEELKVPLPDRASLRDTQVTMQSFVDSTLKVADSVVPLIIKKNKLNDDCMNLRRVQRKQASLINSAIYTRKRKCRMGYKVLSTSINLLQNFKDHISHLQTQTFPKSQKTSNNKWSKKLNNFPRLEKTFLDQIDNINHAIGKKQETLESLLLKADKVEEESKVNSKEITKAKIQFKARLQNDEEVKKIREEARETKREIEKAIHSNDNQIKELEKIRHRLENDDQNDSDMKSLLQEAEELDYQIFHTDKDLYKVETKQIEMKELRRYRIGLIFDEEKKSKLMDEEIRRMQQEIPILLNEISDKKELRSAMSFKLLETTRKLNEYFHTSQQEFYTMQRYV